MTILATMLSGSLMPSLMARLVGSVTSSVEACGRGAGCANGATLNALYSVVPSGEKVLPPTFCSGVEAADKNERRVGVRVRADHLQRIDVVHGRARP